MPESTYEPCQSQFTEWEDAYEDWLEAKDEADDSYQEYLIALAAAGVVCGLELVGPCILAIATAIYKFDQAYDDGEEANLKGLDMNVLLNDYIDCCAEHKIAEDEAIEGIEWEELELPDDSDIPDEP